MPDYQIQLNEKAIVVHLLRSMTRNYHNGLNDAIDAAVADGATRLVIDLKDVSFIDSSGITALLKAKKSADVAGAAFYICNAAAAIQSVLKSLNLERVFNVKASLEEALK